MKIQVLGSGCPTCKALYELVQKTVNEMGMEQEVEYITDIAKLIEEGIATSPALKVDGKVVCAGRILSVDEIKEYISNTPNDDKAQNQGCSCDGCC